MKSLFFDTRVLDDRIKNEFCLTEDILMENAAMSLEERIRIFCNSLNDKYLHKVDVLIVCGSGDNGADGLVLARRLKNKVFNNLLIEPCVFQVLSPKSNGCKTQRKRAEKIGVKFVENIFDAHIVVDCLFGSGFHGKLDKNMKNLIDSLNLLKGFKLACDVPSALDCAIKGEGNAFVAEETVTMGARKISLFLDDAKDYTGKIITASLGISDSVFEDTFTSDAFLLEESDLKLPSRKFMNVHKGCFGHTAVVAGNKKGAALIAASAAFRFGAGLVSLIDFSKEKSGFNVPSEFMISEFLPKNATALALGMGLGQENCDFEPYLDLLKNENLPVVLDADIFYYENLPEILSLRSRLNAKTIITPHPKEFAVLLKNCGLADVSSIDIQKNRLDYAKTFCNFYKNIVLILKGSTSIICLHSKKANCFESYFNPHGLSNLSKGGSGDVLSGLAAALLAQNWNAKAAAIQSSLAHALASKKAAQKFSSYALTPQLLIDEISLLEINFEQIRQF
ncbi:MAG: NAD(P)H-hydrate dehydratase [Treponema sp.]|jgi:hydroxyethylthiazole kinase-like uncharacterized protein yjeF|nr:NAD(P)H-hydrate dehydratase [Treponema sp.]